MKIITFKSQSFKHLIHSIVWISLTTTVHAASNVTIYDFNKNGSIYGSYSTALSKHAVSMYGGSTSAAWIALIKSGQMLAPTTTKVRALDRIEDYQYNFYDSANSDKMYYDHYFNESPAYLFVYTVSYPHTLSNFGPHAGESLFNNPNFLALGDDNSLWLDSDMTLSVYNMPGASLQTNHTWTTFTSGTWAGQTLASRVGQLVGYEESTLYFLEGDNTIVSYFESGAFKRTEEFNFSNSSLVEFQDKSLADLIDGNIEGYSYLGWDINGPIVINVTLDDIPEPTSASLALLTLSALIIRRRNSLK